MYYSNIFDTINNNHVMLLYDTDDQRQKYTINCINKELDRGHFCIYTAVDPYDTKNSFNISNISCKISNYYENIKEGNLQIINIRAYFESAILGDLTLFKKLKLSLEEILVQNQSEDNKRKEVLIIIDMSNKLINSKYFLECVEVEKLIQDCHSEWIQNSYNITIVCLHPRSPIYIIKGDSLVSIKDNLANFHKITIV